MKSSLREFFEKKNLNFVSLKDATATLKDKKFILLAVEILHIILFHKALGMLCVFNA